MADKYELPKKIDVYTPIAELVIASVNGDKSESPAWPLLSKEMTEFVKNLQEQVNMIVRVHDKACSAANKPSFRVHAVRGRKAGENNTVKVTSLADMFGE